MYMAGAGVPNVKLFHQFFQSTCHDVCLTSAASVFYHVTFGVVAVWCFDKDYQFMHSLSLNDSILRRMSLCSLLSLVLCMIVLAFMHPASYAATTGDARGTSNGAFSARGLTIIDTPSVYFTPAHHRVIDTVVIHFSSAINTAPNHWADATLVRQIYDRAHVSPHYMIDRLGKIYRLVQEKDIAWHAGGSIMPSPDNRRDVNRFSIGIELIATSTSGYTEAQYQALSALLHDIKSRNPIRHIVGHDEISGPRAVQIGLRADRKEDPGPLFDWNRIR